MNEEKITLSFSKIFTYMQCGIKYELKYVRDIKVPESPFTFLGKSIHAAVGHLYNLKEKQDLKIQDIKDIVFEILQRGYEDVKNAPAPGFFIQDNLSEKEVIERIERSIVKMVNQYFEARIKKTTPLWIEQQFLLDLKKDAAEYVENNDLLENVYILGYIDFVDTEENIIELKTSIRRPQADIIDRSDQLTMYALGYVLETGVFPNKVILDYIVHDWLGNPDKVPMVMTYVSTRTKEDIQKFLDKLARVVKGIRLGVFLPPDQYSWACVRCAYKHLGYCKFSN